SGSFMALLLSQMPTEQTRRPRLSPCLLVSFTLPVNIAPVSGILHGEGAPRVRGDDRWLAQQGDATMHTMTRRQMLHAAGAGAAALLWSPLSRLAAADQKLYTLPPLPYGYDALKKSIDEETMKIHHDLHHKAYVDNLNNALKDAPDLQGKPIE